MIVKAPESLYTNSNVVAVEKETVKVLHLINGEHFAGAERVQDLLANALPQFGYDASFACLKTGKFKDVRKSTTDLFELNMRNSFDLFVVNEIVRVAKSADYKLLHAHTPRSLMVSVLAAKKLDMPLVYHVHSPVGRDSTRKFRNRINTWVETKFLGVVDAMICVSGSLKNYMNSIGHDADKLHVVRNGVPVCNEANPKPVPRDQWTIGTMALYRPRKGIETLLAAMANLIQRGCNVHLRAVGGFETPEYEAEVMKLVNDLGVGEHITWTGFQRDIHAQFDQMDVFVLPSLFGEGLPMVVLEAMAQAVPVIASDVEGIPEAVRDKVDGLICEPGSPEDMAEKIFRAIQNPGDWQEFGRNSMIRQRSELSDISMARGVAEVYDSILG